MRIAEHTLQQISAMPLRQALALCPRAVVVPVRHHVYSEYSRRVMDLARAVSPLAALGNRSDTARSVHVESEL